MYLILAGEFIVRSILGLNVANSNASAAGRVRLVYVLLLCAIQFLLGIFYLGAVPLFCGDEAWDASIGCEFAKTGVLRHPFIHNFGGMEVYFVQPRVLLPLICAGVFKLADYSIAVSRLPSLLFGVLAVVALYRIAERFFGNKQSFLICLAVIINPCFWIDSRRCRPEMYYAALALLFLWLVVLYFRCSRAFVAFLAGIIAALAILSHPNGLIITAAISISWIVWKEKPHLFKFVMWALAGFVLAILPYIVYVFWATRHPDVSFLKQMRIHCAYSSEIVGIIREATRWRIFLQLPLGIPLGLVMFAGWLVAWWKSTAEDKFTATVVTVYVLALPFLTVNIIPDYLIAVVPFFCVLIVRLVYRLNEFDFLSGSARMCYIARILVILIYVVSSLSPIMFMLYRQHDADFNKVVDEVAKVVGPKARVDAISPFWIGCNRYIYGPYLMTYSGAVSLKDALQWVYSQSFDYSIRTVWNGDPLGFKKLPNKMPQFRSYFLTDNLCKMFGTKVHEFYNEYYGPVEIYKIDWPQNPESWGLRKQAVK